MRLVKRGESIQLNVNKASPPSRRFLGTHRERERKKKIKKKMHKKSEGKNEREREIRIAQANVFLLVCVRMFLCVCSPGLCNTPSGDEAVHEMTAKEVCGGCWSGTNSEE